MTRFLSAACCSRIHKTPVITWWRRKSGNEHTVLWPGCDPAGAGFGTGRHSPFCSPAYRTRDKNRAKAANQTEDACIRAPRSSGSILLREVQSISRLSIVIGVKRNRIWKLASSTSKSTQQSRHLWDPRSCEGAFNVTRRISPRCHKRIRGPQVPVPRDTNRCIPSTWYASE